MISHYSQAVKTAANVSCPIDFCDIHELCPNEKSLQKSYANEFKSRKFVHYNIIYIFIYTLIIYKNVFLFVCSSSIDTKTTVPF